MQSIDAVAWVLFSLAVLNLWHTWDGISRGGRDPLGIILAVWLLCYACVQLCSVIWRGQWH